MHYSNDISFTGSNLLITVNEVKQFIKSKDNSFETSLSGFVVNIISYVSDTIENYCNKTLTAKDFTGYYDGSNCNKLYLDNYPINSISELKYRINPSDNYSNNLEANISQSVFIYPTYIQLYSNIFPYDNKSIKIIYNAGYSSIPGDIKIVALEMCQTIYNNSGRGNGYLGLKSISDSFNSSAGTMTFDNIALEKRQKEILDKYKKYNI